MKSRLACAAMLTALAWAPASWAVGLGEADLRSALNQPLDARISLVSPTQQELEALRVALASPEHFERYGLERTALHTRLRFQLVEEGNSAYIRVTTQDPVREPFVSFLVEARWASGRLLREYTFLLDPPTYGPDEADQSDQPRRAVTSEREPERGTRRESQQAQATEPEPETETRAEPEERTVRTDTRRPSADESRQSGGRYGPIRRNETLWNIADRLRPSGVSINQMMIALFQANPGAFGDNINYMREGAVLRVPERNEIESVPVAQANRQVAQQNESWRGARTRAADTGTPEREQQDELRLVAPGDEDAEGVGVGTDDASERVAQLESELEDIQAAQQSTAEENEELSARVSELQSELEEQRRLVELKDEQLASLQERVREGDLEEGLEDDAIFADEQPGNEDGDTATGAEGEEAPSDEADADEQLAESDKPDSDKPGEEDDKPTEEETVATGPSGEEQADGDADDAGTDDEIAETPDTDEQESTDAGAAGQESADEEQARRGRVAESPSILDRAMDLATSPVGMGALGALALAGLLGLVAVRRRGKSDDDAGDETSLADEAADAAEAEDVGSVEDVNLSGDESGDEFGDDAGGASGDSGLSVDEVIDEADFHIAYGTYDKAASQIEEALNSHPREGRLHLKLLEAYFAASNAEAFVSAAERLRNELGEDGPEWSEAARMGQEIAPDESMFAGAAPSGGGESGPDLAPPSAGDDSGTDDSPFDLDLDTGDEGESQEPAGLDIPDDSGSDEGADLDLPDAGETDSTGALGDTVDTSEDDDDLSFDLPDLEEGDSGSGKEEPATESASGDDEVDFDWSDSDDDSLDFGLDEDSASTLDRTSGEASDDDGGEEVDFPTVDVPPEKANEAFGTDSQAQFEKAFQELSSYIGSEGEEEGGAPEKKTEDRPGQTTDDDASPSGIDFGDDDDDDLLDLGEEDGDEVGEIDTKVDLARAYIDMGDSDGARGILEEVIEEGNDDQKKEAQSLLDSI